MRKFLSRGEVRIKRSGTDRYGRTLTRLTLNGRDTVEYLIRHGLARNWQLGDCSRIGSIAEL
ncbi:MAG: thermonuclease family protein [Novosphingobium sp.]